MSSCQQQQKNSCMMLLLLLIRSCFSLYRQIQTHESQEHILRNSFIVVTERKNNFPSTPDPQHIFYCIYLPFSVR